MKQAVDHCEVMGVNLLVEKGGEELLYCEEGMADRENRRLISRDTIFRLYSQTKPVTAACAMILMEEDFWIRASLYPSICLPIRN